MTTAVAFLLGVILGILAAWLWAASRLGNERKGRAETQVRLEAAQQRLEEQKRLFDAAASSVTDTFKAVSADALRSNSEAFLQLARNTLAMALKDAEGDLGRYAQSVGELVHHCRSPLAVPLVHRMPGE